MLVSMIVWLFALQVALVPLLLPSHVQLQRPVPVTADAVPVLQRLVVGAVVNVWLLEILFRLSRNWTFRPLDLMVSQLPLNA
jgi:hypothetical protein